MPGFGSLMAGRISGYGQVLLGLGGLALTAVTAARFFGWYVANFSQLKGSQEDPLVVWAQIWHVLRWPLLGMAVFGAGWLWALFTSLQVLHAARQDTTPPEPPRLQS